MNLKNITHEWNRKHLNNTKIAHPKNKAVTIKRPVWKHAIGHKKAELCFLHLLSIFYHMDVDSLVEIQGDDWGMSALLQKRRKCTRDVEANLFSKKSGVTSTESNMISTSLKHKQWYSLEWFNQCCSSLSNQAPWLQELSDCRKRRQDACIRKWLEHNTPLSLLVSFQNRFNCHCIIHARPPIPPSPTQI